MTKTRLSLRVSPGARRDRVELTSDGGLKIRLRAPAVDGKANAALIKFLAKALRVPSRNILIRAGLHSRNKLVEVLDGEDVEQQLRALAD